MWRRRSCPNNHVFTTLEATEISTVWIVSDHMGRYKPFERDQLFISLYNSLEHRKTALSDAGALAATIMQHLAPTVINGRIAADEIRQAAQAVLDRFDTAASTHYRAFHPAAS